MHATTGRQAPYVHGRRSAENKLTSADDASDTAD